MSAGGTYGTQGKPKSRLARGRGRGGGREGGRLSEDVSIQGAGSQSALIHFIREAGTPLESLPLLERVFLLPRPGLGGATGGVKDPLEDAADQAPGGRPGCNAGDLISIPGSGRYAEEGNGNPLQYSGLENSIDRGAR